MDLFLKEKESLRYLSRTGRYDELVKLVEAYTKDQGLYRTDETPDPVFTEVLELDLGEVETSVAGPKRPQDRITLPNMKQAFNDSLTSDDQTMGFNMTQQDLANRCIFNNIQEIAMKQGDMV